jgi:hypothetical protein
MENFSSPQGIDVDFMYIIIICKATISYIPRLDMASVRPEIASVAKGGMGSTFL